jgi:hypothetical protein
VPALTPIATCARRNSSKSPASCGTASNRTPSCSTAQPGIRLSDFADEVRAQKGNLGSFEELLKTADPKQSLQEFARRFLVDRILVAASTPKSIADKPEELHFATGANGGFILGRGYWAMDNIREMVSSRAASLEARKNSGGRGHDFQATQANPGRAFGRSVLRFWSGRPVQQGR